jgi:hypothetical protein
MRTSNGVVGLTLQKIGYGARSSPVRSASPVAVGRLVLYRRGSVLEWYRDSPLSLEQGFKVSRRPAAGVDHGPLTFALAVSGPVVARQAGSGVVFERAGGKVVLRYGALSVRDATGRLLRTAMLARGRDVLLRVWDRGARYPLRVDPTFTGLVHLAAPDKGTGAAIGTGPEFGHSVAMSQDGNTILVGGEQDDNGHGAAWVYLRTGFGWKLQQKLTPVPNNQSAFGFSVALSASGDTALIGGPTHHRGYGTAWVFERNGTHWALQRKFIGPSTGAGFGWSVGLSGSGDTAIMGAPGEDGSDGAAWVARRAGTRWTKPYKLTAPHAGVGQETGHSEFG